MEGREFRSGPEGEINYRYLLANIGEWKRRLASVDEKMRSSEHAHEAMLEHIRAADEELSNLEHYMEKLHPGDPTYEFKKEILVANREKFVDSLESIAGELNQASKKYQDQATAEMEEVIKVKSKIEQVLKKMGN